MGTNFCEINQNLQHSQHLIPAKTNFLKVITRRKKLLSHFPSVYCSDSLVASQPGSEKHAIDLQK